MAREFISLAAARRSLALFLGLQLLGDIAMALAAYAVTHRADPQHTLSGVAGAAVTLTALVGLLFAIAGPPVVLRVISKSPQKGWVKLLMTLLTLALSVGWCLAAIHLLR